MTQAKRILASPRMNRAAALVQMAAVFEWSCPEDMARAAWKRLSPAQQGKLDKEVQKVIAAAETEE